MYCWVGELIKEIVLCFFWVTLVSIVWKYEHSPEKNDISLCISFRIRLNVTYTRTFHIKILIYFSAHKDSHLGNSTRNLVSLELTYLISYALFSWNYQIHLIVIFSNCKINELVFGCCYGLMLYVYFKMCWTLTNSLRHIMSLYPRCNPIEFI